MPSALKDLYTPELIRSLADALKGVHPTFNVQRFVKSVLNDSWPSLELKQRMRHITECTHGALALPYPAAVSLLRKIAPKFNGFIAMFFPDFVEVYGESDYKLSLEALHDFTRYSSSEFAIRPFIIRHEKETMKVLLNWAKDKNENVRRLASEGCRPRLPWAMALPSFKKDPSLILPVLELLKDDPSEYVRRSVANNLNDISKDHPALVLKIAKQWKGESVNTDKIIRHACRTLLKQGNAEALRIFGFMDAGGFSVHALKAEKKKILIGEKLGFSFRLQNDSKKEKKARIEYAVHFVKANGSANPKVFKVSEALLRGGEGMEYSRSHRFQDFTTRKHYPGKHKIDVRINGIVLAEVEFMLEAGK